MTTQINLTQLRERFDPAQQGNPPRPDFWYLSRAEALALIDTAEAAMAHIGVDVRYPQRRVSTRHRLRETLNRYTTNP